MSLDELEAIRHLFVQEIPEIANGVVEIKAIAREVGSRTKIAVHNWDHGIDCVGACVGERGVHIKQIVEQTNGERFNIVRWNDSIETFIANALLPAEIEEIRVDRSQRRATVLVREDQVSIAVGRRGLNRRLAGELCGYKIEVAAVDQNGKS